MKYSGFAMFCFGMWWMYIWQIKSFEGRVMILGGYLIASVGFFLFFEGLKNEIIKVVKNSKDTKNLSQKKEN